MATPVNGSASQPRSFPTQSPPHLAAIHLWLPPTPGGRKIAQEENNRPDLLIAQRSLRSRHAGGKDAVIDNPLQLPIRVSLNLLRSQRRHRRRHMFDKWDACILAIHPMACDTVVTKRLFP